MFKLFKMPEGSDPWIKVAVYVLILFGVLMIVSASMSFQEIKDPSVLTSVQIKSIIFVLMKQSIFLLGGYLLMVFITRRFKPYYLTSALLDISVVAMAFLLVIPYFSSYSAGGAKAWISLPLPFIGAITIQPAEFAKLLMVLVVAEKIAGAKSKMNFEEILKYPALVLGGYSFIIIILQSDFGSFVVMFLMSMICFMACSHQAIGKIQKNLFIVGVVLFSVAIFLLSPIGTAILTPFSSNYKIGRFLSAANPFIDPYGDGYQLIKGLTAFAAGGLNGVGLGNSFQKYTDFPAAQTDYILAILVEELGFIGFLFVLAGYTMIIFGFLRYAVKIQHPKAKVILVGVSMYFFIHFVFNVGGVSGLIPLTGVPLLLISSGGSSTVSALMAIGLGQSMIYRYHKGDII